MVSGRAHPRDVHHSIDHRTVADALLPSLHSAGLCGHEEPAVCGVVGIFLEKSASLVGAGHGSAGVYPYGQGVLSRSLSAATRTELGGRLDASPVDAAT